MNYDSETSDIIQTWKLGLGNSISKKYGFGIQT